MSYITKFGSFWGMLPQTSGRAFWVAPAASYTVEGQVYSASNDNDGLSPERALRTVDYAVGLTTASVGDVIVLLPGAHSVTATITVDVAGITIVGIPGSNHLGGSNRSSSGSSANRSQITSTEATGMIFTVTAVDVEIAHLHLAPITAGSGISVSSAAHRAYIHDCTFDLGATANTATMGVTMPVGVTAEVKTAVARIAAMVTGRLAITKEMRELDDRFGLTPKAMAALRWKIVADEAPAATGAAWACRPSSQATCRAPSRPTASECHPRAPGRPSA